MANDPLELMDEIPMLGNGPRVADVLSSMKGLGDDLEQYSFVNCVATIGSLHLFKELQSNCIRLEALAHAAVAKCSGGIDLTPDSVATLFECFNDSHIDALEDPAESVFASNVYCSIGNFLIPCGIWESSDFYTQRLVTVVDKMRHSEDAERTRRTIFGLLKVSDLICKRAGLERNCLGHDVPAQSFPAELHEALDHSSKWTILSPEDLAGIAVSMDDLLPFVFHPSSEFLVQSIDNSDLQRCPLVKAGDRLIVALPSALSYAVRSWIVNFAIASNTCDELATAVALEYQRYFALHSLLGLAQRFQLQFQRVDGHLICQGIVEADRGRFIQFLFVSDNLLEINKTGISGFSPEPERMTKLIADRIQEAKEWAKLKKRFREGMTLLVYCGVGRGAVYQLEDTSNEPWTVQFVSAPDLAVLSFCRDVSATTLFQIRDIVEKLQSTNVQLWNVNGLLNIFAWIQKLEGHAVPHSALPMEFGRGNRCVLMIEQNALCELRQQVALMRDIQVVLHPNGSWVIVGKFTDSFFGNENSRSFYNVIGTPGKGVYCTSRVNWWCELIEDDSTQPEINDSRWDAVATWTPRIADVLNAVFDTSRMNAVCLKVAFEQETQLVSGSEFRPTSIDAIVRDIQTKIIPDERTVVITVGKEFEIGLSDPENISEFALVVAAVRAFAQLFGQSPSITEVERICNSIVPGSRARQLHHIVLQTFRQYICGRSTIPAPIFLDNVDDATHRLGIGWLSGNVESGRTIQGIDECLSFLNQTVRRLEDELCAEVKRFDREALVVKALENYESCVIERMRWNKTAGAILAFHGDGPDVKSTIINRTAKTTVGALASRILAEVALCECTKTSEPPSDWDTSKLLCRAASIFNLAGTSNAIRWKAIEPRIVITPMGDIHFDQSFSDDVMSPFGQAFNEGTIQHSVATYDRNYRINTTQTSLESQYENEFIDAWNEEFGISMDNVRAVIEVLEDEGLTLGKASFAIDDEVVKERMAAKGMAKLFNDFVKQFVLESRPSWHHVPQGFTDRDRQPWSFRRRLSLVRRPLVSFAENERRRFVVTPGLCRDALSHMLSGFSRGDIPDNQLVSSKMRTWSGKVAHRRGSNFSHQLSKAFEQAGWQVEVELRLSKLLGKQLDRDYGDVDVLAWNRSTGHILVCECKDLQFRKTHGEIAEQLLDFKGRIREDGTRDELRKHLDRIDVIFGHLTQLQSFCDIESANVCPLLVFRHSVPMQYAWKELEQLAKITTFEELEKEFQLSKSKSSRD